jgi:hypothetical protein
MTIHTQEYGGAGEYPPNGSKQEWLEPKPLPIGLLPVPEFDVQLLPPTIGPWAQDIADRMQCPLDFIAIPALVALGAVIGRKIGVRPQAKTDWLEVANLWGCVIGPPGTMKSPAVKAALAPLHRLERDARKENDTAQKLHTLEMERFKIQQEIAKKKVKAKGGSVDNLELPTPPEEPKARRYITDDTSYEALSELLADNPNGMLAHRDELVSLLRTLDQEQFAGARGFFLQGWNGTTGYTCDRIIRGSTYVEAVCISLLGTTQPSMIARYIHRAMAGGVGDDGLIQRFGLLVWPDGSPDWKDVDRYADTESRQTAWSTFDRLDKMQPEDLEAQHDPFEPIPFLRFDDAALGIFREWRQDMEMRLRRGDMHPALQSHLAKYRSLVPSLALIGTVANHESGAVSEAATMSAIALSDYLWKHAKRCYASKGQVEVEAAKAILGHIRGGRITDGFSARDIQRHNWADLTDGEQVKLGLGLLVDLDWLAEARLNGGTSGGRPKMIYKINPKGTDGGAQPKRDKRQWV